MTTPWNELGLSEAPAVALLERFGYAYIPGDTLDAERTSPADVVLTGRLERALEKLNPWLNDGNLQKAVREITHTQATSLLETSEKLHGA